MAGPGLVDRTGFSIGAISLPPAIFVPVVCDGLPSVPHFLFPSVVLVRDFELRAELKCDI